MIHNNLNLLELIYPFLSGNTERELREYIIEHGDIYEGIIDLLISHFVNDKKGTNLRYIPLYDTEDENGKVSMNKQLKTLRNYASSKLEKFAKHVLNK